MSDTTPQPRILTPVPDAGTFMTFELADVTQAQSVLARVLTVEASDDLVIGLGEPLVRGADLWVDGLRVFPSLSAKGVGVPSTQGALWAFLAGGDGGERIARGRALVTALGPNLRVVEDLPVFRHDGGRDLTGYEDGTENPEARAHEVALVGKGPLENGSFVAVQRWIHDLVRFSGLTTGEQDATVGRSRVTNEELQDAAASAHVKRAAQESFEPEAFMLRRSMPWGTTTEHGLYFVAFGSTLDLFERVLTRMTGLEDGVQDALFRFTRPVTGGYYFCPPRRGNRYDLSGLVRPLPLPR